MHHYILLFRAELCDPLAAILPLLFAQFCIKLIVFSARIPRRHKRQRTVIPPHECPKIYFTIPLFGGIGITQTTVSSFVVMLLLCIAAVVLGSNLQKRPSRRQVLVEKRRDDAL